MAWRREKKASAFVDLETLGKWDDSVILSQGITILKDEDIHIPGLTYSDMLKRSAEFKYNVMEQVRTFNRKVDPGVMDWWKKQGEAAARVLKPTPQDHSILQVIDHIKQHAASFGLDISELRFLDRNSFDMNKLQHVHEVNIKGGPYPPWDFQEVWGIETILKFLSEECSRYGAIDPKTFDHPEFIYHSASCDAALDAFRYYLLFQSKP